MIAVVLYYTGSMDAEEAFRKSLFQVISLHTSTGFATDDYMLWTLVLWGLLTIVMVMGACAGSTSGGLKCIRMVILAKVSRNECKHLLHPNAVLPVRINKQVIPPSIVSTVLAFFFLYFIIIIISILIMMGMGIGAEESIGCVVSILKTLVVPRGGEYKLVLEDGSRVYLNSIPPVITIKGFRESKATSK